MQARVAREGEIFVVNLSGRLDVETAEPFRHACLNHLIGQKVVFDFRGLSFVGSSGILPFLQTMQEFAGKNQNGFKFSGVGSEFRKVFSATSLNVIDVFETSAQAVEAFLRPMLATPAPVEAAPIIEAAPTEDSEKRDFGLLSLTPELNETAGETDPEAESEV